MSRRTSASFKPPPTRSTRSTNNSKSWNDVSEEEEVSGNNNFHRFQWGQQSNQVLQELKNIYNCQFQGPEQGQILRTDVTLVSSEGNCVDAHKMILFLCSPFFRKLFTNISQNVGSNGKARNADMIVLSTVNTSQLQYLLQFIYTGEAAVKSDEVEGFKSMGQFLEIDGISSSTTSQLASLKHSSRSKSSNNDKGKESPAQQVFTVRVINDRIEKSSKKTDSQSFSKESTSENVEKSKASTSTSSEREQQCTDIPCKTEPFEGDEFGGGASGDDDCMDRVSNFSDELGNDDNALSANDDSDPDYLDEESGLKKPKRRGRGRPPKSQASTGSGDTSNEASYLRKHVKLNPLNPPKDWKRIEPLTPETVKNDWRLKSQQQNKSHISQDYYCAHGRNCPAQLKIKKLNDGGDVFFSNQREHANHRIESFGLTPEQKLFVLDCLNNKVYSPNDILLRFEVKGVAKPKKSKLVNMLMLHRRKHPSDVLRGRAPKGQKWRRPKVPKVTLPQAPRTPERPRTSKGEEESDCNQDSSSGNSENPSTSSNQHFVQQSSSMKMVTGEDNKDMYQPTGSSHIPHPNHYPGSLSGPYSIPHQSNAAAHADSSFVLNN